MMCKKITQHIRPVCCALLIASSALVMGCASTAPRTPGDPLEPINRVSFQFNEQVDKIAVKPVAKLYKAVTPWPIRTGVSNFFSNMGEVPTMANDFLQGQLKHAISDLARLAINSTVGIGGAIDVASHLGLEKRYNDLGITLAKWGIAKSPYLVIPLIGPSTIRDALTLYPEYRYMTVWPLIDNISLRNSLFALDVINLRASLLDAENVMDQAALDRYVFIRDAYLQKRASLIRGEQSDFTGDLSKDPLDDEDLDFALGLNDEDLNFALSENA